jgi:hypothetical protein
MSQHLPDHFIYAVIVAGALGGVVSWLLMKLARR